MPTLALEAGLRLPGQEILGSWILRWMQYKHGDVGSRQGCPSDPELLALWGLA